MPNDKKPVAVIVHPATLAAAQGFDRIKKAIAALEKKEGPKDTAQAILDDAMIPWVAEFDPKETVYHFISKPSEPSMRVSRYYNKGRATIDREALLERGVDPAIIDYATDRTQFEYWRMEELPPEQPVKEKK